MEILNNTPNRAALACAAAGLMAMSLAGCSEQAPDYEGTGSTFEVHGVIDDVDSDGEIYIDEDKLLVDSAAGLAIRWFPEHDGQNLFSSDFHFEAKYSHEPSGILSCGHDVAVGKIIDTNGQTISPEQLEEGSEVKVTGRIRDSRYWQSTGKSGYCTTHPIATYETVEVTHRPFHR